MVFSEETLFKRITKFLTCDSKTDQRRKNWLQAFAVITTPTLEHITIPLDSNKKHNVYYTQATKYT
jgi:hypothetical protein